MQTVGQLTKQWPPLAFSADLVDFVFFSKQLAERRSGDRLVYGEQELSDEGVPPISWWLVGTN